MKKVTDETEKTLVIKQQSPELEKSNIPLQPLILRQDNKRIKGTKSLPYEFGAETYEVYSNPKNPFMVGILASDTDHIKLDPINTQNLFQQFEKSSTYSIEYPLSISPHRKRKVSNSKIQFREESDQESYKVSKKINDASNEYLPKEKLKEDRIKLQTYIQSFCSHFLKRINDNHSDLSQIVNEIVPLFVKHKIRIRFYEAFRQIRTIDDLIITLEKICSDFELENFELFCSAIFVFYSSRIK